MGDVVYQPIGVVHSPFKTPRDVPIQATAAEGVPGCVDLPMDYVKGLKDVEGFSYLILIYHFHLAHEYSLLVKPFLDKRLHGLFATRAHSRPNPVGLLVVRLTKIENNLLHIQDVDRIDGTPLLDIKPFIPEFDQRNAEKIRWLAVKVNKMHSSRDDGRFAKNSNM